MLDPLDVKIVQCADCGATLLAESMKQSKDQLPEGYHDLPFVRGRIRKGERWMPYCSRCLATGREKSGQRHTLDPYPYRDAEQVTEAVDDKVS